MKPGARLSSRVGVDWQRRGALAWLLLPIGLVYGAVARVRRALYTAGWLHTQYFPVPVIVVGNVTVGGSGKTPLVIDLVEHLAAQGYRPGVVSRGYRGSAKTWPQVVNADSDPSEVGDEPVIIARRTRCPVVVDPDRCRAVTRLLDEFQCDVVVSDDGLQHQRLGRCLEILVVDGIHRFGNGFCLPAGPLREPSTRVNSVDLIVCNGGHPASSEYGMRLLPETLTQVSDFSTHADTESFVDQKVHAVAGIGHPDRFFHELQRLGLAAHEHVFPDHHAFVAADFEFGDDLPVIMTEKDAVKCKAFANSRMWFVPVSADLGEDFYQRFLLMLQECDDRQETA
jgi:tetraacyldisaccharide 4'-kinase